VLYQRFHRFPLKQFIFDLSQRADVGRLRHQLWVLLGGRQHLSKKAKWLFAALIFILSFSMKSLVAVDLSPSIYTDVQPAGGMAYEFHRDAISIIESRQILFSTRYNSTDTWFLIHPPGYPIYLAAIYSLFYESYFTVQLIQNILNSLSPVLILLIAGKLLTWQVGIVSGFLAAVFHHFSYYSNFILPDSLCALPILLAVYLLVLTKRRRFRVWWMYIIVGSLLGMSVWLRPNTLLLGLFITLFSRLLLRRKQQDRQIWIVAVTSLLFITPITIRNYLIFGEFVPISSNTGIVLWEGIADAGGERFGAVSSDGEVAEQESILYDNPEYARGWAWPDGIKRDRDRITRSLTVITDNPLWFARAMVWRMGEMFKYSAHAPLVLRSTDQRLTEENQPAQPVEAESKSESSGEPVMSIEKEHSRRLSLAYGESIYWARPLARFLQRVAKETTLFFIFLGMPIVLIFSCKRFLYLSLIPLYYLLFQSTMHLEFRYTLPMQYFVFVFAAVIWVFIGSFIRNWIKRLLSLKTIAH
jgi:hypothetical protein